MCNFTKNVWKLTIISAFIKIPNNHLVLMSSTPTAALNMNRAKKIHFCSFSIVGYQPSSFFLICNVTCKNTYFSAFQETSVEQHFYLFQLYSFRNSYHEDVSKEDGNNTKKDKYFHFHKKIR
jgi:hypothetical protein